MMIKEEFLSPSFLNSGELFIKKYHQSIMKINKSSSNKKIFLPGTHKYNSLLEKFLKLNICMLSNDKDSYHLCFKPINYFNIKQNIAYNYIKKYRPDWYIRFRKGRDSLHELKNTNRLIYQSLHELGLFDNPPSNQSSRFISEIRNLIYLNEDIYKDNTQTGILGEKLSMEFEHIKTGVPPKRISLDDDYAGFDIISFYKENSIKRIEVKASKYNIAYISWNEWKTALESSQEGISHEFHLWSLQGEKLKLAILTIEDLHFIPKPSKLKHHFDKYLIYYDNFIDRFNDVEVDLSKVDIN